ncbi:hypothetical protein ABPG74_016268 [Tetrahymena malaccensis]
MAFQLRNNQPLEDFFNSDLSSHINLDLNLYFQEINLEKICNLSSALAQCQNLERLFLNLEFKKIDSHGMSYLSSALINLNNLSSLTLMLGHQQIDDEGITFLSSVFEKLFKLQSLTLSLQQNKITENDFKILSALQNCQNLITLNFDVSQNKINALGASKLGNALTYLKNLKTLKLNVSNNNICEKGANDLGASLEKCVNLQNLKLCLNKNLCDDSCMFGMNDSQKSFANLKSLSLDFSQNQISSRGIQNLGLLLSCFSNLACLKLKLDENQVDDIGIQTLVTHLKNCKSISTLEISLSQNSLGVNSAFNLSLLIENQTNMSKLNLNLSNNQLGPEGAFSHISVLQKCKNLTTLELILQFNQIGEKGAINLGSALSCCSQITYLMIDLSSNCTQGENIKNEKDGRKIFDIFQLADVARERSQRKIILYLQIGQTGYWLFNLKSPLRMSNGFSRQKGSSIFKNKLRKIDYKIKLDWSMKIITKLDLFSQPFNFHQSRNTLKKGTIQGIIFSLLILLTTFAYFLYLTLQYIQNKIDPIFRSQSFVSNELIQVSLQENLVAFKFDYGIDQSVDQYQNQMNLTYIVPLATISFQKQQSFNQTHINIIKCSMPELQDYYCLDFTGLENQQLQFSSNEKILSVISIYIYSCQVIDNIKSFTPDNCANQTDINNLIDDPKTLLSLKLYTQQYNIDSNSDTIQQQNFQVEEEEILDDQGTFNINVPNLMVKSKYSVEVNQIRQQNENTTEDFFSTLQDDIFEKDQQKQLKNKQKPNFKQKQQLIKNSYFKRYQQNKKTQLVSTFQEKVFSNKIRKKSLSLSPLRRQPQKNQNLSQSNICSDDLNNKAHQQFSHQQNEQKEKFCGIFQNNRELCQSEYKFHDSQQSQKFSLQQNDYAITRLYTNSSSNNYIISPKLNEKQIVDNQGDLISQSQNTNTCMQHLSQRELILEEENKKISLGKKSCEISEQAIFIICYGLSQCTSLQSLLVDLQFDDVGAKSISDLGSGLSNLTNLINLKLFLSKTNICDDGISALANGLQKCSNLTYLALYLQENNIQNQGLSNLGVQLARCTNLVSLIIDLNNNQVGAQGLNTFGNGISFCKKLQTLNISLNQNQLCSKAISSFGVCLAECSNLKFLDLQIQNNQINNQGIYKFASEIVNNKSIIQLTMLIDKSNIQTILRYLLLKKLTTLVILIIDINNQL